MKLSAYRASLLSLTDQVLADYELQVLLQPTSTTSPYFGKGMKAFAEQTFNTINSPQVLTASTIRGTPIPGLTDLDTLPGENYFVGRSPAFAPTAPALSPDDFRLPSGQSTKGLSRNQILTLLKASLSTSG